MFKALRAITLLCLAGLAWVTGIPAEAQNGPTTHSAGAPAPPRIFPIAIIDFYGLNRLSADQLRDAVTLRPGDTIVMGNRTFFDASRQHLMAVPGVVDVHLNMTCCVGNGAVMLYVGIVEKGAPAMHFRGAPTGSIRLPADVLATTARFNDLGAKAVQSGHASQDGSEGHARLAEDPTARPVEDHMIELAQRDLGVLRRVLRESSDADQRATAAQVLGYAKNMQSVVPDLEYAMSDPDPEVRNNAMRALWVFTEATKVTPPRISYEPFVALLNSPDWTDRNKASLALSALVVKRDPKLLALLRQNALVPLTEMARWKNRPHAQPAIAILGAIAGLPDDEIRRSWDDDAERERIIHAANGG